MRHRVVAAMMMASLCSLARAQTPGQAAGALVGRSDAVELRVESFRLSPRYGPTKAGEDKQYLIVQTTWRNVIGGDLVTPYKVPELSDQLFLIVGGGRVVPVANFRGRPGVLSTYSFTVGKEPVSGALVFELPAGDPGDLMLAMVDENNGVIRLPLKGRDPTPPKDKPTQQNQVLDVAVVGTRELNEKSPAGTKLLAVDLRWSSRVRAPKAKTGRLLTIPDWRETFQLVVDGEFVAPLDRAPLEKALTVLPEIYTGGELVFRVPADRSTTRVDLHFSQAQLPGEKKAVRPKSISFDLQPGAAPPLPTAKQTWKDSYFESRLVDSRPAKLGDVAGTIVRYRVTNRAKSWETLQAHQQYRVLGEDRERPVAPDRRNTAELPRGGDENLLIPPGETRQFDLAYPTTPTQIMYASADPDGGTAIELVPGGKVATTPQRQAIARNRQPEDDEPARTPSEPTIKPADYPPLPDAATLKAKGLAGVGLKPEQVNAAIDRGADALWQLTNAHFADPRNLSEVDMLAALAMSYSGLHKRNPDFNAGVNKAIETYRPVTGSGIYQAGIMLMLIESYGNPQHLGIARELAQGIVNSQCADGSWQYAYNGKRVEEKKANVVSNGPIKLTDGEEIKDAVADTGVIKRNDGKPFPDGGDNSTTQYAILGLSSAQRMGIAIDPAVWTAAAKVTAARQNPDEGGWAYHNVSSSYGSMTAAGMTSLSIAKHYSADPAAAKAAKHSVKDAALERGMRWFNAYFSVNSHPQSGEGWLYYYLYGVERLGRVLDTEFIGKHEWYPAGARFLVDQQGRDGAWRGKSGTESGPEYATSFALLFLTKATPTLEGKKEKLDTGTLALTAKAADAAQVYFILDCSGSMLAEIDGKMKFDIARDAVKSIINSLPDKTEVGLRVYGHRKRAIEKDADKDVEEVVRLAPLDRKALLAKLDGLRARGKTPLAESLSQTAKALDGEKGPTPINVILLTDGGEDTRPRGNPVAAAGEFAKLPNTRLKIIGFDINQEDWAKQLGDMAAAGKGSYTAAANADKLAADLIAAVAGTPGDFTLVDAAGKTVASGSFGQTLKLNPGKYQFQTAFAGETFKQDIHIAAGRTTTLQFAP